MIEISEIADELRDEVLQTILAVRLNLAHAAAGDDCSGVLTQAAEAREHLAVEAGRIRTWSSGSRRSPRCASPTPSRTGAPLRGGPAQQLSATISEIGVSEGAPAASIATETWKSPPAAVSTSPQSGLSSAACVTASS